MIHLARAASLVAVLLLVAIGTASAAGTWVLWVNDGGSWNRLDHFSGESGCRTSALRVAQSLYLRESGRRHTHPGAVELKGTEVHIPVDFDSRIVSYECYPDTIDPRGPKAK
jgi:hypothetical protein